MELVEMTDSQVPEQSTKKIKILVLVSVILALLVAAVAYFAWSANYNGAEQLSSEANSTASGNSSSDGNNDVTEKATPAPTGVGTVLPEAMSGQEAIDALGPKINQVAEQNSLTVEELEALLLRDDSAHVSKSGRLLYLDTGLNQAAE